MRALCAAALLSAAGCAAIRAPREPTAVDHGLMVVSARVRGALIPFLADEADRADVEQLDFAGGPIPGKVAASGVRGKGGAAVFVDLPPGRYALTSISFRARGVRYVVAIPPGAARKNAVDLRPGKAAFLGELSLDGRFPEFDVAVERALTVVVHWATPFLPRPLVPRDADLRGYDLGPEAEARALRSAGAALAGTQWPRLVEARLREIGAPAPAATVGALRRRAIPLRAESTYSWRDTLRWGEPARSPEGLAWRRPDGTARIAVFFTSAAAPGFVGYDEAVRRMRAAAGGLQDPAATYEVFVGTRAGRAARTTSHHYPESTLTGSRVEVIVTETVLVSDPRGLFTARLRAERAEFEKILPVFREFLRQIVLGPPPKDEPKGEPMLPP